MDPFDSLRSLRVHKKIQSSTEFFYGEVAELVYRTGLENQRALTGSVGSNPTLSVLPFFAHPTISSTRIYAAREKGENGRASRSKFRFFQEHPEL